MKTQQSDANNYPVNLAGALKRRLPDPLDAIRTDLSTSAGRIAFYSSRYAWKDDPAPLVLVHSVNAAASAFEVRPLFEQMRGKRAVYSFDLPGFGNSDRSDRHYTVASMVARSMP